MEPKLYIERRPNGHYAIYAGESTSRARGQGKTQAEAIRLAKTLDPKAMVLVERVRHNSKAGASAWRMV